MVSSEFSESLEPKWIQAIWSFWIDICSCLNMLKGGLDWHIHVKCKHGKVLKYNMNQISEKRNNCSSYLIYRWLAFFWIWHVHFWLLFCEKILFSSASFMAVLHIYLIWNILIVQWKQNIHGRFSWYILSGILEWIWNVHLPCVYSRTCRHRHE